MTRSCGQIQPPLAGRETGQGYDTRKRAFLDAAVNIMKGL